MSRLWARLPLQTTQKGVLSLLLNFLFPISKLVNFHFVSVFATIILQTRCIDQTPFVGLSHWRLHQMLAGLSLQQGS